MRILSTELRQLKRIAIINAISNCVWVALIGVISCNLTPLPIVLSDSKIELQEPNDKKDTLFIFCKQM